MVRLPPIKRILTKMELEEKVKQTRDRAKEAADGATDE